MDGQTGSSFKPTLLIADDDASVRRTLTDILESEGYDVITVEDGDARLEALSGGADDFLIKPLHFAELKARVKNLATVKAYYDYMKDHQFILE